MFRNQFNVEFTFGVAVGGAFRIKDKWGMGMSAGAGGLIANISYPLHFNIFTRFELNSFVQFDFGFFTMSGSNDDSSGDINMKFRGLRLDVLGGYRFIYLGPTLWVGATGGEYVRSVDNPALAVTLRLSISFRKSGSKNN